MVCVVGWMRDLILQLSKSSIYSTKPGMSSRTLTRRFRAETGFSFNEWRQRIRLLRALELLAAGKPVTAIALDLGYDNVSAFIALFRRMFGTTPGRYKI
ncbi:helix-turn-helix domain-containing protein, partial [Klebsiella pneumoniae]